MWRIKLSRGSKGIFGRTGSNIVLLTHAFYFCTFYSYCLWSALQKSFQNRFLHVCTSGVRFSFPTKYFSFIFIRGWDVTHLAIWLWYKSSWWRILHYFPSICRVVEIQAGMQVKDDFASFQLKPVTWEDTLLDFKCVTQWYFLNVSTTWLNCYYQIGMSHLCICSRYVCYPVAWV